MNPDFCQKNCALNWDTYLNGCILKREITVLYSEPSKCRYYKVLA